jgi:hypothetical protein
MLKLPHSEIAGLQLRQCPKVSCFSRPWQSSDEAIAKAKRLLEGHDVELWSGERFVARLSEKLAGQEKAAQPIERVSIASWPLSLKKQNRELPAIANVALRIIFQD